MKAISIKELIKIFTLNWKRIFSLIYFNIAFIFFALSFASNLAYATIALFFFLVIYLVLWFIFGKNTLYRGFAMSWFALASFGALGTYSIIYFIKEIISRDPSIILIGSSSDWIGFAGSVIGGSTTMLALLFTIHHEKILNSLKSLPYFNIELDENNSIKGDVIDLSNIDSFGIVPFRITNSSNFNAIEFKITHISFYRIGTEDNYPIIKDVYKEIIDEEFYGNIFYSKETRVLYLPIFENLAGPVYYNLLFEFEYFDFIKVKKYKVQSINLVEVSLNDIRRDELEMYIGKEVTFTIKQDSSTYRYLNL